MEMVSSPAGNFSYAYQANSDLIETITGPVHSVSNVYESNRDTLDIKQNKVGSTVISRYDYAVNGIGQRTNLAQSGAAFSSSRSIAWGYDSLGQVTSADSTIPSHTRAYAFDMIGNRLQGSAGVSPASVTNFTANALNQYSSVGAINPVYDDDGNATAYPLPANVNANSSLVWDGENRLISATVNGVETQYVYDSQSRKIATKTTTTTTLTAYDGWNPIAEYKLHNSSFILHHSLTWGLDLSGTLQGAGGVGGLLAVSDSSGTYYPTFDGNGNVSEYLDSTGAIAAHYEYDPFGKTIVSTGAKANEFAHRFSTKPIDATTGLYYYGYRFYDPDTGRWLNRDPIEEQGGVNLYGFVGNDGVNVFDLLGLKLDGPCKCKEDLGNYRNVSFSMSTKTHMDRYTLTDPGNTIKKAIEDTINAAAKLGAKDMTKHSSWRSVADAIGKLTSTFSSYKKALNAFHETQSGMTVLDIEVNAEFELCVRQENKIEFVTKSGYGNWSDVTGLSFFEPYERKQLPGVYLQALEMAAKDVVQQIIEAKEK
jgi:RHS repeat-associated protein